MTIHSAVSQVSAVRSQWEYQLIPTYSDEFNGTSLNTTKWSDYDPHSSRSFDKAASYTAANCIKVEPDGNGSGVLKLIAKNETIDATDGWNNNQNIHFFYQGALLTSKAYFKCGYYEIRAKKPKVRNTNGMAFWFWHREDGSLLYSEIDVFETQPAFNRRYPMALHYSTLPDNSYEYNIQTCDNVTTDMTNGDWHTYGLEWTQNSVSWYIDGVLVKTQTDLERYDNSGLTVSTSVLGKMRMTLNNIANFGMEASTQGDTMIVDYIRYYKRKPNIRFLSYDATTGYYTYVGYTGIPEDTYTWVYTNTLITDVSTYTYQGLPYIKFKRVSPTGAVPLGLRASQVLTLENSATPTATVTSQNSLLVGEDNSYFYIQPPYFSGSSITIKAFEAAPSAAGNQWLIGLKNTNGSIDWSAPQTQTGSSATFTGLLSGKTYVVKHRVNSVVGVWTEFTKEVPVQYDAEFFVQSIHPLTSTSNTLNMLVYQRSSNPDSEWHIELVNDDGTINTSVDQPKWGSSATFTGLLPGKNYKVRHGNYGPNQAWVESSKIVHVDFESNFEFFYAPNAPSCLGGDPDVRMYQGFLQLFMYSKPYVNNPNLTNYSSGYYIYELDANGSYQENATPLHGPIYGQYVAMPVQVGKNYMVKHGVYSPNGHWTETRKTVRILPQYVKSLVLGSTDSLNQEGIETAEIAVNTSAGENLRMFPNPTEGALTLEGLPSENLTLTLFDATGRMVLKKASFTGNTFDISTLAPGTYYIKIESPQGTSRVMPIIKK